MFRGSGPVGVGKFVPGPRLPIRGDRVDTLRVELLGPVRAWYGGRELDLGPPRRQAVLAVLALRAGGPVSRNELIDAVWGESPPASAVNNLHIYIGALRRALGGGRAAAGELLRGGRSGYQLSLAPGQLDVTGFDGYVQRARRHRVAGDPAAVVWALDAALALWRGTPLAGITGPFAEAQRVRLGERRLAMLEDRADALLALGPAGDLVVELATLVDENPLRERLCGLLMRALHRDGRRAQALTVYTDARRRLVEELGIEPGPELRAVHQAVLADDWPAPDEPPGRRIPPGAVVPRQLPAPVRHFAGRAAELKVLDGLLDDTTDERTVVISAIRGTAGIGKTALAVLWAHRVADRFPDGQLYVNLRGVDPAEEALPATAALRGFLDGLGVRPERIPADLDAQAGLYRSLLAGRRMLVVLDNARDAEHVRPLLPGAPGCLAVVTSRDQLTSLVAREGAYPITLDSLSPAESIDVLSRHLGPDRVAEEPDAVAAVVRVCGGLPLALGVVAAWAAEHPGDTRSANWPPDWAGPAWTR
jgi:DNA-binding SARP family transcriptional activator